MRRGLGARWRWENGIPTVVVPAIILVGGLLAALLVAHHTRETNDRLLHERFVAVAQKAGADIARHMAIYEYGLRGARGAVVAAGVSGITRERFHAYALTRDLDKEFPGARGFGFVRRIAHGDDAAFVAAARRDGMPDFDIRVLTQHDAEHFVIQYIEPVAGNEPAIGLDIASEEHRRAAALRAMRSGRATMTEPIKLVQTGNLGPGFLIMLPIYRPGPEPATVSERIEATVGWAYVPLHIEDVLTAMDVGFGPFWFSLSAVDDDGTDLTFYTSRTAAATTGLVENVRIELFDQAWTLSVHALPEFVEAQNLTQPRDVGLLIAAASILLSALAFSYLAWLHRRARGLAEKARMAAIVTASNDAIIGETINGRITNWNPAAERILGFSEHDAVDRMDLDLLVPPEFRGDQALRLARVAQGELIAPFNTVRRRKDGTHVNVSLTMSPIIGEKGTIIGIAKFVRDITEQLAAESRIIELNRTLEQQVQDRTAELLTFSVLQRAILAHAGYSIIATNPAGTITVFNPAAEAMLGYAADEVIGRMPVARLHDRDEIRSRAEALTAELGRRIDTDVNVFVIKARHGRADQNEWTYIRKDGSRLPVLLTVSALRDSDGNNLGALGIAMDLTQRKRQEQALRDAKTAAEAASQSKSDFLANMSHEIRTPLNAILGLAQVLARQTPAGEPADVLRQIIASGRLLLAIIDDILTFSKLEADRLDLEAVPFDLDDISRALATIMSANVAGNDVETLIGIAPDLPRRLVGDPLRLQQILINLVGNALKFTERGFVAVRATLIERSGNRAVVRIAVEDSGIGMTARQCAALFQPFTQADASTTRRFGGTGLGLAISKRLVEMMGGEIGVHSKLGKGSEFWIRLPLVIAADAPRDAAAAVRDLRVLAVDDSPLAREFLSGTIRSLGWTGDAVGSIDEGIERLRQAAADRAHDAVLVDWQMPDQHGLAMLRRIRKHAARSAIPVVLMVTAHERDAVMALAGGELVNAVLTKPVNAPGMRDAVIQALGRHNNDLPAITPRLGRRLQALRLLVVEDNPINQDVARRVLGLEGADVTIADDGMAAVDILKRHGQDFDLVLMDAQMPVMDGFEATRLIRSQPGLGALPIVALTAGVLPTERQRCLDAGMNDFVAKPFDIETLVSCIRRLCRGMADDGVADGPNPPATPAPPSRQDEPALPLVPGIDLDQALGRLGGQRDLLQALLAQFMPRAAEAASRARALLDDGTWADARRYFHTLRGGAAQVGAAGLAATARDLEHAAADAQHQADWPAMLARLAREADAVVDAIVGAMPDTPPPPSSGGMAGGKGDHDAGLQKIAAFRGMLARDDVAAIDAFRSVETHLAASLPPPAFAALKSAVDSLDFAAAAAILDDAGQAVCL